MQGSAATEATALSHARHEKAARIRPVGVWVFECDGCGPIGWVYRGTKGKPTILSSSVS